MLKQFTVQAVCPVRQAYRMAKLVSGLTLVRVREKGKHVAYDVLLGAQKMGRVFGSGWTCSQFAAFVPFQGHELDFDQEVRLEDQEQLSTLFSLLSHGDVKEALELL